MDALQPAALVGLDLVGIKADGTFDGDILCLQTEALEIQPVIVDIGLVDEIGEGSLPLQPCTAEALLTGIDGCRCLDALGLDADGGCLAGYRFGSGASFSPIYGSHGIMVVLLGELSIDVRGGGKWLAVQFHAVAIEVIAHDVAGTEGGLPTDAGGGDVRQLFGLDSHGTGRRDVLSEFDNHRLQRDKRVAVSVLFIVVIADGHHLAVGRDGLTNGQLVIVSIFGYIDAQRGKINALVTQIVFHV